MEQQSSEKSKEFMEIKKTLQEVRDLYNQDKTQQSFNLLLLGEMGSGKTQVAATTSRAPVLLHSFDPGGTKHLKPEIQQGTIVPDARYEVEPMGTQGSKKMAQAFSLWERNYQRLKRQGAFEHIGTYMLDSFTTWLLAMGRQLAKKQGRTDGILQIQDWQIIGNTLRDYVMEFATLPCDTILTGHIAMTKNELEGGFKATIKAPPSLQIDLPLLFDEIYVLEAKEDRKGNVDRKLITQNNGTYECRTRIGRREMGNFDLREEPNIKSLLRKAGMNPADKEMKFDE